MIGDIAVLRKIPGVIQVKMRLIDHGAIDVAALAIYPNATPTKRAGPTSYRCRRGGRMTANKPPAHSLVGRDFHTLRADMRTQ